MKTEEEKLIEKALRIKCERMDWLYQYSSDLNVYQKGVDQYALIRELADALGPEGDAIINEYKRE